MRERTCLNKPPFGRWENRRSKEGEFEKKEEREKAAKMSDCPFKFQRKRKTSC